METSVQDMARLTRRAFSRGMTENTPPTLVLGGTGKTGRRVAQRLTARHLPVRIGSRAGTPPFDWNDRAATAGTATGSTAVRASWFHQNFSESHLLDPIREGLLALPVADVPEPFIHADDIADVAVAALTDDTHTGHTYELTGPRLLTFADATAHIAQATGRDIRFAPIPLADYTHALTQHDLPPDIAWLLPNLFTEVLDGRNAHLTDGVQQALGRPPRDFNEYAKTTADTGIWDS
jgi:uncharacterized protein YbjT (DUF2867 family)